MSIALITNKSFTQKKTYHLPMTGKGGRRITYKNGDDYTEHQFSKN